MKRALLSLLLVSFAVGLLLLWQQPQRLPKADSNAELFFPKYDAAHISRIEIEQLLEGVQLKKIAEVWEVAPLLSQLKKDLYQKEKRALPQVTWQLAEASRVKAALGVFGGLERGVLVSHNLEKQALYHVGKQGLGLRLFDQHDKLFGTLIVGKNGPDFASTYVRRGDEQEVYLVNQSLLGIFSIEAGDWLKREDASPDSSATLQAPAKQ